ncbi:DUF2515 family protein [Metabacillus arenae]|uniref:DUF2515 family protein n=1 Tax=Metabacillus arenae TaxID=2771434 RepID=A0A926RXA5_9BACI|nr:DUF2515 family protein [Metabacillus arenae]MBD1381663.1 DUF2515 family protein [Metabacillus arenae]
MAKFSLNSNHTLDKLDIPSLVADKVKCGNIDNISRTIFYANFFTRHPEIKWAFLASMVSRNAGWCMTDLEGSLFKNVLTKKERNLLFLTYEDANWLIFSDASPQLLLYEISKATNTPLFNLLRRFNVSEFMIREWYEFWKNKNGQRLLTSLIINEQNLIQRPVLQNKLFKKFVFKTFPYKFQDFMHFSTIIFPTLDGELYGFSVHGFLYLKNRIELGKRLSWLLFHPCYFQEFLRFSTTVVHTGSRYDFEKHVLHNSKRSTPFLRTTYPEVTHHIDEKDRNWFHGQSLNKFYHYPRIPKKIEITEWYLKKQQQLKLLAIVEEYLNVRKHKPEEHP